MITRIGYYPGCSLKGTAREYEESLLALLEKLGIELEEIQDWNCCGASAAHGTSHYLSLALPARILALAEQAGLTGILAPCSGCYNRLKCSQNEILGDPAMQQKMAEIIGMPLQGNIRIYHLPELLEQAFSNGRNITFTHSLDMRVACYYGCYLTRPAEALNTEYTENPMLMDHLLEKAGAQPVDWDFKVECCGAAFAVSRTGTVARLSGQIIENAVKRGAQALIVACPLCHANLDLRRNEIEKALRKTFDIPVLYLTQALGMAMGIGSRTLGLHRHSVPVHLSPERQIPETPVRNNGTAKNHTGIRRN